MKLIRWVRHGPEPEMNQLDFGTGRDLDLDLGSVFFRFCNTEK